jgi:PPK2 family polyphosphate:nucleotide phosphotransferase
VSSLRARLRAGGDVSLASVDPASTPKSPGGRHRTEKALPTLAARLADLQERVFAAGRAGGRERVLLVLQGLDTSGKGGTVAHVCGAMDPSGLTVHGFAAPTPAERRHGFLWRVRQRLPVAGQVGIFDRSHYEDVVAVRVRGLAPRSVWEPRFAVISRFERSLARGGCTIVKVFLHISREEQRQRLLARLDDPTKWWKFSPGDLDDRDRWGAYVEAYEDVLRRCDADHAPWYVVPADHKWYRNWAVATLLVEHLEALGLGWPPAGFDIDAQRARLLAGA